MISYDKYIYILKFFVLLKIPKLYDFKKTSVELSFCVFNKLIRFFILQNYIKHFM